MYRSKLQGLFLYKIQILFMGISRCSASHYTNCVLLLRRNFIFSLRILTNYNYSIQAIFSLFYNDEL